MMLLMATWGDFEAAEPDLAAFGASLLMSAPAYLATVRGGGGPRVHPVTPIIGDGHVYLFMEPTSPKRRDLDERSSYAMHNGMPDSNGTGGEFWLSGRAVHIHDRKQRAVAVAASQYEPEDRYVLFELEIGEARCNGYGDVELPGSRRWRDPSGDG